MKLKELLTFANSFDCEINIFVNGCLANFSTQKDINELLKDCSKEFKLALLNTNFNLGKPFKLKVVEFNKKITHTIFIDLSRKN